MPSGQRKATAARKRQPVARVLGDIAKSFFDFYGPYGEYFDFLLYSYKGMKEVQIHGTTLTRLMSVTLSSLDRLKEFIVHSPQFNANDEDESIRRRRDSHGP